MIITLQIKNIIFKGLGIIHLINFSSDIHISFQNCYIANTVANRDIIRIENHPHKVCAGVVHFRHCRFINNVMSKSSKAISCNGIHCGFHHCFFMNNSLASRGLVKLAGGFSSLNSCYFERNSPKTEYAGGAVYALANSNVKIFNCSFKNNVAMYFGGALLPVAGGS